MKNGLLISTFLAGTFYLLPVFADEITTKITVSGVTELEDSVYQNYNTKGDGGAISVTKTGGLNINQNTLFNNNQSNASGGAIYVATSGTVNINGETTFSNNNASSGGAIYASKNSILNISQKGIFEMNSSNFGGAISTNGQTYIADGSLFSFNKGTLGRGGGIYIGSYSVSDIGNDVIFSNNTAAKNGGAIYNYGTLSLGDGAQFISNSTTSTAGAGGAIYNYGKELNLGDGALFLANSAVQGGAIYQAKDTVLQINAASFIENKATGSDTRSLGGAILVSSSVKSDISITNSLFENNSSQVTGGAIGQMDGSSAKILIDGAEFKGNQAKAEGGAIVSDAELVVTNSTFTENKTTGTTMGSTSSDTEEGGGAIFLYDGGKATVTDTTFSNNTSGTRGGAIATRSVVAENPNSYLHISDSTFENNTAAVEGGAVATYVETTISDSTFSGNSAEIGGALKVAETAKVSLTGENTFQNNSNAQGLNDIDNSGEMTVDGSLTLDGGISGNGTTIFSDGSSLTVNVGTTVIENNVINQGAVLNMMIGTGFKQDEYTLVTGTLDKEFEFSQNAVYNITAIENGSYEINKKSTDEIAANLGISLGNADVLEAVISSDFGSNENFIELAKLVNEAAQLGDGSSLHELENLGADKAPIVQAHEVETHNMLFDAINGELRGDGEAISEGKASGDVYKKRTAWIRGMYNHADKERTAKANGFSVNNYGVAMGIDGTIERDFRLGFGYAQNFSDIKGDGRDTDVTSSTAFIYGQYKPANWYINAIAAYGFSDYQEKKTVLHFDAGADYDVETFALSSLYGYEAKLGAYDVTPEFGLRYLHISQESYTDNLGTLISGNDSDILTAVISAKASKNFALDKETTLRPEFKLGVTYDILTDKNNSAVMLNNGAAYQVYGERLNRLGFEIGAKALLEAADDVDVSAGYTARLRNDYQDHTVMFDLKYHF